MVSIVQQIGRYEVLRELGRGAMGVVYAAIDPLIGRMVAIKTIRLDTLATEEHHAELTRRLYREAQSAGILSHHGIITIHDVGERGNVAYIVMEYVDGTNLEEVLDSGVPQHSGTLLSILKQAAVALDYAHGKGIIHRDIKPSNLMICRNGVVKIADFGVAKLSASASTTQAGLVLGTPSYMSPEQAQGLTIDGRADQFSLGVVAYQALTGVLPFQGPTLTALLAKILMEEPQYDSAGMHPYLQFVFKRVLAKDPQARFQNCSEFTHDLEGAYALFKGQLPGDTPHQVETATAPADTGALNESAGRKAVLAAPGKIEEAGEHDISSSPAAEAAKSPSSAVPPPSPEARVEAPKRKSRLIAWVASLLVLVLAATAFLAIKTLQTPGAHPDAPAVAPLKQAKEDTVIDRNKASSLADPSKATRAGSVTEANIMRSDPDNVAPEKDASSKPTRIETASKSAFPSSGTITWTGKLDKNSVLVISSQKASVGNLTGELPGRPVSIEVQPSDVLIRKMPDKATEWKQIMLYSGSKKFTSITINWQKIK